MLLDSCPSTVADMTLTSDSSLQPTPYAITQLEKVFRAEIAFREEMGAKLQSLKADYAGIENDMGSHPIMINKLASIELSHRELRVYIKRVEAFASRALSLEGAPFKGSLSDYSIEASEAFDAFEQSIGNCEPADIDPLMDRYSPLACWRAIAAQFNPDAQKHAANRQAAHKIRDAFDMYFNPPEMKLVSGRVELQARVYLHKDHRNERTLTHDDGLHQLGQALEQSCAHAGLDIGFGRNLASWASHLYRNPVVSRRRIDLGDGVYLVLGYEHFKFYFPQSIAAAINVFLAEYPTDRHGFAA